MGFAYINKLNSLIINVLALNFNGDEQQVIPLSPGNRGMNYTIKVEEIGKYFV